MLRLGAADTNLPGCEFGLTEKWQCLKIILVD